jgi:hypothetical protein
MIFLCGCLPACLPTAAHAAQSVRLDATLTPERLGQETTIGFGFQVLAHGDRLPSPLTNVEMRYPAQLGIALSGLGFASCSQASLEAAGPQGCPPDSLMGYGTATAEIPIGPSLFSEIADVTIFRAPAQAGQIGLLFHVGAASPVSAELVFPGLLLSASPPFGGRIDISVPLVPSLPDGPNVAVMKLRMTVGPAKKIFYYERVHGKTLRYHPKGVLLPNSCPAGGFPFAASFAFEDGSHAIATSNVPCPPRAGHRAGGRGSVR